jgi:hypothetical protein
MNMFFCSTFLVKSGRISSNMTISNFAYEKKRQKVRKILDKSGWKINDYLVHDKSHNVYFCHMETGEQFLSSLVLNDNFDNMKQNALKHKNGLGDMVNYLCVQDKLTKNQVKELQQGVSLWAITTQSFEQMESQRALTDFSTLIMFYKGIKNDAYIRPVCFPTEAGKPVEPEIILEIAHNGLAFDRQTHPERFNESADIIDIRSKK